MRILNTKNPDDIIKIYPWLIPTETMTRMDIVREIIVRLHEQPDDIFICIAIDHHVTQAVLIAHISETRKRSVWVWQAHAAPGFKKSRLMFDGLKAWVKSKGNKYLRAQPSKEKRKFFERAYGFKQKGSEMKCYVE